MITSTLIGLIRALKVFILVWIFVEYSDHHFEMDMVPKILSTLVGVIYQRIIQQNM